MNLSYKIVTLKELGILVEISRKTFINAFEKANNPDDFKTYIDAAFNKKQIESEVLNPDSEFYFVFLDDEHVGYFKINENEAQAEPFGNNALEISRIYVLNDFQGQKLGTHILNKIIDIAHSKQKLWLWLGVWDKNIAAIRFYERHGFVKFNSHDFYMGNDRQTDWLMRLNLI